MDVDSSGRKVPLPPAVLRQRKDQSKKLRMILDQTESSRPALARALRVRSDVFEAWAEGLATMPNPTFVVIEMAFDRWSEMAFEDRDGWPDFDRVLVTYAREACLAGFRS
jgi:hypothetical protein